MSISSEQEQLQAIKRWLQTNGVQIVLSVAIVGGGYFGWKGWESYREGQIDRASDLYADFIRTTDPIAAGEIVSEQTLATATELAGQLTDEFSDSLYSVLAEAELARLQMSQGDLQSAETLLRGALERTDEGGMRQILQLRLARVLQAKGEEEQALELLREPDPAFAGLFAKQRGSILQQSGRIEEAIAAYNEAISSLQAENPEYTSLLRLQIQLLSGEQAAAATNP